MKLRKSKDQGDLEFMIQEEGVHQFIRRNCMDILDGNGELIGEIKGYTLNLRAIKFDMDNHGGRNSFIALDMLSELCCWAWEFLESNKEKVFDKGRMYFLNRISFFGSYENVKNHEEVLELLCKSNGAVLYSIGSTELEDDFPESPYENFYEDLERSLLDTNWESDDKFPFYFKKAIAPTMV